MSEYMTSSKGKYMLLMKHAWIHMLGHAMQVFHPPGLIGENEIL